MNRIIRIAGLIVLLPVLLIGSLVQPVVAAESISDYYSISYSAALSKTEVTGSEIFFLNVSVTASCNKDLPITATEAYISGMVVALNNSTGASVTLNPVYDVTLSSFPQAAGETTSASQTVNLQFPGDAVSGSYTVYAQTIQALIRSGLWVDVTAWLPSMKQVGTVTYTGTSSGGGGGFGFSGGGQGETASIDITGSSLAEYLNSEGRTSEALTAASLDGGWQLDIAQDTLISYPDGTVPVLDLTVVEESNIPESDTALYGVIYRLQSEGLQFNPAARLTVKYDPADLPADVPESALKIVRWNPDNSTWEALECSIDTENHTLTASLEHFSYYAVAGIVRPAEFELTDFAVSRTNPERNEAFSVKVRVTNSGDLAGTYQAVLTINGTDYATREVELSAGESQEISFNVTLDQPGVYSLGIQPWMQKLTVAGDDPSPTVDATQSPSDNTPAAVSVFSFSDLKILASEVSSGETVDITFVVSNSGSESGECRVEVKMNGETVETRLITLEGGSSQTETVTLKNVPAGVNLIEVNGLTAGFTAQPSKSELNPRNTLPVWAIIAAGVFIVLLVLALLGWLIYRLIRKRRKTN